MEGSSLCLGTCSCPGGGPRGVEVIAGVTARVAGRRHWPAHEKLRIVEEGLAPGESVSAVARRDGVAPNLLFRWRRLMAGGRAMAVGPDEPVVAASEARRLEERVRELERLLGRKTMEAESLREALAKAGARKQTWQLPSLPREAGGPTHGSRRITALVNRERHASELAPVNRKRVLRIMRQHALILERSIGRREGRVHAGPIAVMRSNLRRCSDALKTACWNGEVVRPAFLIDAFDREAIAHVAVTGAGISGSDMRDMMLVAMLEAVCWRPYAGGRRAPLRDRPGPAAHRAPLGQRLGLHRRRNPRLRCRARPRALLHPRPQPRERRHERGLREPKLRAAKTLRRDHVRLTPLPDAATGLGLVAGWIEDHDTLHPRSALQMRSPREFIAALNPSRTVR